jgi:hypothetical protein
MMRSLQCCYLSVRGQTEGLCVVIYQPENRQYLKNGMNIFDDKIDL